MVGVARNPIPVVSSRGCRAFGSDGVDTHLAFCGVDGKGGLRFKEPQVRDGVRRKKKDTGSKKDTQEVIQDRERGIRR